jgi:hypothetical protein
LAEHTFSQHPAGTIIPVLFGKLGHPKKLQHRSNSKEVYHWLPNAKKVKDYSHLQALPSFLSDHVLDSLINWSHTPACYLRSFFECRKLAAMYLLPFLMLLGIFFSSV